MCVRGRAPNCERGVKMAKATVKMKSAGTSPAKCPICPGWVTVWTAMIAQWNRGKGMNIVFVARTNTAFVVPRMFMDNTPEDRKRFSQSSLASMFICSLNSTGR